MLHTPSFASIGYTDRDDVNLAIDALRRHSNRTIGLITPGALPYAFVSALKAAFAATTFIDVTSDIECQGCRWATKSECQGCREADLSTIYAICTSCPRSGERSDPTADRQTLPLVNRSAWPDVMT